MVGGSGLVGVIRGRTFPPGFTNARRSRHTVGMTNAVIVDAIRTPLGKRNGRLKDWHPVDLAAETLKALQERNGLDPAIVDDVVMGCVMQVGEQAVNVARNAV